ncbi:flagellar motor switch phosphatase FliY [Ornithinibacillus sp. 4-3]|uniref:Flagellar motor switch phosphatase FliY n=1 Tax=Ornithinibacillus sp. 4-3 TaxID=3231488 RepID=A0AB39HU48_9BACI
MSEGMLTQEEINALLNMNNDSDNNSSSNDGTTKENLHDYLSDIEIDTLGEIGNISFGSAATTLSTLLNQKVDITTPEVSIIKKAELLKAFPFKHVGVQVNYVDGFTGSNLFVIKSEDAAIISDIMLGGDGLSPKSDLNEIHLSAVQEAMNQMMGAAATSMSTIFNKFVNISPPTIELNQENEIEDMVQSAAKDEDIFVKVSFQLIVGDLIDSNMMQLIPFPFAHDLVDELLNGPKEEAIENTAEVEAVEEVAPPIEQVEKVAPTKTEEQADPQMIGNPIDQSSTIQSASFSQFEAVNLNQNEQRNLDMLLDIPLRVTVELGRTKRTIKNILELTTGSIVELDKLAGEPVDILVNEKLIAKGEVVVIDENFGVRVTDVISPNERLMKLK